MYWFVPAAEQGHKLALSRLLHAAEQGNKEAVDWLLRAAKQGHKEALDGLLRAAEQGHKWALDWLGRTAEQGHTDAQYNLGLMYSAGRGVPQNDVEAHKWLNLAASAVSLEDRKRYVEERDRVAERMTPEQIDEAQQLASE